MAEHINRDAFLEQQRAWYCKDCNRRKNTKGKTVYEIGEAPCRACDIGTMLDAVEDYPAADVVERKTGKWIPIKGETGVEAFGFKENTVIAFFCSNCDEDVDVSEGDFNFCPNCGAQMIGGDEKDV